MPLIPTTLNQGIKAAIKAARLAAQAAPSIEASTEAYDSVLAQGLTTVIDTYIRSGTVTTVGSPTTQTGTMQ